MKCSAEYFSNGDGSAERGSGSDGTVGSLEDDTDFRQSAQGEEEASADDPGGAQAAQRLVAARAVLGEAPGAVRVHR